jgi:DNA-binding CsgD family transcriptional regulator/PAS domain-containing protein
MFQTEASKSQGNNNKEETAESASFRKVISTFRKLQFNSSTQEFIHKNILDLQMFDEMDFGVYLIDYQTGKYAYVNDSFANILGIRREDIINEKISLFSSFVHPDDFPKVVKIVSKTADLIKKMDRADRSRFKFRLFYRLLKGDGSYCWAMQSNKVIDDTTNDTQIDFGMITCLPEQQSIDRVAGYLKTDKKCIEISGAIEGNSPISSLSPRELEVLTLVSKGFNSKEISMKLQISEQTIKIHRKNILKKLMVNTSIQAIRLLELG